jgi:PleD family two-component response regulator
MVASRIGQVGGGGKAYRFGGEEFTILFPGVALGESIAHLETVRKTIADYKMRLRSRDRPAKTKSGKRQRGSQRSGGNIAVTISIGAAERTDALATPDRVLAAADKALYRAKNKGRNNVSK